MPVYAIYGASEDLTVIEKFKSGTYSVANLNIIDEHRTYGLETPSGHTIRLMGIGGSLVLHRFFDNGDGTSTIAGTHGLMWTTALQVGQLIQTVRKTFDESEIRVFVSHPCPSREGLFLQLALSLRADFTISSSLHFIYGSSFNEFTVEPTFEHFQGKLASARAQFMEIWDRVKAQVLTLVEKEPKHKLLITSAVEVFEKMPEAANSPSTEYLQAAYRNMWNFNLSDAEYGSLVLNVVDGRVAIESRSQGFNFQYRKKPELKALARTKPETKPDTRVETKSEVKPEPRSEAKPEFNKTTEPGPGEPSPRISTPEADEPGVWLSNGHVGEEDIRSFFRTDDRELITKITVKESYGQPDKKFALVYFASNEQAQGALDRIDKEKAGKVSLIGVRTGPRRGGFFRGGARGGRGGSLARGRGAPRPAKS